MTEITNRSSTEFLLEQSANRVSVMTQRAGEEKKGANETPLITALALGVAAVGALLDIADAIRELKEPKEDHPVPATFLENT